MPKWWPLLLGAVLGIGAVLAGLQHGADEVEGWRLAARWTARVGLPVFLVTYSASSLGRLWPSSLTRSIWQGRRWWGLGFAASHTIHLYALVTYLNLSGEERPLPVLIGGGGAYVMLYLMALTSNDAAMRALGRNWKRLHTVGIHWLWFVFAFSYFGRVAAGREMPYSAFAFGLTLVALALRIAAWRKGRRAS